MESLGYCLPASRFVGRDEFFCRLVRRRPHRPRLLLRSRLVGSRHHLPRHMAQVMLLHKWVVSCGLFVAIMQL